MPERRKQIIRIPIFSTFFLAFVMILCALIVGMAVLYYSTIRRVEKSKSVRWKEKPIKVTRFLDLPHGYEEELKDNEELNDEKLYYETIGKILSLGRTFNSKCRETSVNGDEIPIQQNSKKLHLGILTLANLAVISDTTHPFGLTLKNWDRKVYFQVVAIGTDRKPYVIHFFERPSFTIEPWKTYIQFCGVFYRMIKYKTIKDEAIAPLFITYTVEKYIQPRRSDDSFFALVTIIVVALLLVFIFLRHRSKVKLIESTLKISHRKNS